MAGRRLAVGGLRGQRLHGRRRVAGTPGGPVRRPGGGGGGSPGASRAPRSGPGPERSSFAPGPVQRQPLLAGHGAGAEQGRARLPGPLCSHRRHRDAHDALETLASGFDADLRVGEDVDLVWRLVDAGWSVRYQPSVTVFHREPPVLGRPVGPSLQLRNIGRPAGPAPSGTAGSGRAPGLAHGRRPGRHGRPLPVGRSHDHRRRRPSGPAAAGSRHPAGHHRTLERCRGGLDGGRHRAGRHHSGRAAADRWPSSARGAAVVGAASSSSPHRWSNGSGAAPASTRSVGSWRPWPTMPPTEPGCGRAASVPARSDPFFPTFRFRSPYAWTPPGLNIRMSRRRGTGDRREDWRPRVRPVRWDTGAGP